VSDQEHSLTLRRANRRKWRIVLLYWLLQGAVVYVGWPLLIGGTADLRGMLADSGWALLAGGAIALLTGAQLLFLLPVRRPRFARDHRTPLLLSLAIAGLAVSVMVVAIVGTIVDLVWLVTRNDDASARALEIGIPLSLGLSWIVSTPLLIAFSRGRRAEFFLSRLAAALFAGTLVETIAIIPIDVMVRRKTDCYCGQGTFLALTSTGAVGLFALGPALLLPLIGRRRARFYQGRCFVCGYDMSGTPSADRCPECGAGWRPVSPER
jgi:hypothetical protein